MSSREELLFLQPKFDFFLENIEQGSQMNSPTLSINIYIHD